MIEMVIIVVLTLCVVFIIPRMIKRDFEQRMLSALKREITHNITQLREYTLEMPGGSSGADNSWQEDVASALPVLKDDVFRRIQQMDFCSKGLTSEDKDMLAKVFTLFSRHMADSSDQDRKKLCMENMRILEEVLVRITDYTKGGSVR